MKRNIKKLGALALALALVLTLATAAFATTVPTLDGGVVGAFTDYVAGDSGSGENSAQSQGKLISIAKELTAYNKDETTINAPTVSYSYQVTAGQAGVSITDAAGKHANNTAVTVQTKAGVLDGIDVGATTTATGTVSWAPTETVSASETGAANNKYFTIDFTNVVFGASGVYRYVITEYPGGPSVNDAAAYYASAGVTPTTSATNPHVRYLDVYVRPAANVTSNGTIAADWDIYGYVCMLENEEITAEGDTTTTGAVKTNGFVAGTNDGTSYLADSYYTYNVTVSKTVTNDAYAKATHAFPFTVIFTNATVTQAVDISSSTTGTASGFTDPSSAALSAETTKGIVTLKDSSSVKYIGIPAGTSVEVYETNDVAGVTYQVTTTVDGTTSTDDDTVDPAVISGSAPTTAVAQNSPKAAYESTKATIAPAANTNDTVAHTVAVDNNMQLISPTGIVLRYGPFALILAFGVVILLLSRRRKEEEN